jgi:hypothetical protein
MEVKLDGSMWESRARKASAIELDGEAKFM